MITLYTMMQATLRLVNSCNVDLMPYTSAVAQLSRPGTASTQLQDVCLQCHKPFLNNGKIHLCLIMHQSQSTADCYNALPDSYVNLVDVKQNLGHHGSCMLMTQILCHPHDGCMFSVVLQVISASPAVENCLDSLFRICDGC